MSLRRILKHILPYGFVINRRNHQKLLLSYAHNLITKDIPKENPVYQSIISVQGFGYSGSGAVLDLLREYSETQVLGYMDPEVCRKVNAVGLAEIEIIRLPGGLYDIENNLKVDNVFLNDALLNRTVKLFENSVLFKHSEELRILFISFFNSITELKMNGLSKTYYNGYLSNSDEASEILFKKSISKEDYIILCKNFLIAIFNRVSDGSKNIVVDQLFSDTDLDIERNSQYVNNLRSIIVVRDPRDIYAWAVKKGVEWIAHNNVDDFILWYKLQYKNVNLLKDNKNCIVIDYENLILDYSHTVKRIEEYLGFSQSMHHKQKLYFDPSFSIRFVGIYKEYLDNESIMKIRTRLSSYCNSIID